MIYAQKQLLGAVIATIGAFVLMGIAWPIYGNIGDLKAARDQRLQTLKERSDIIDKISALRGEYLSRQSDINRVAAIIPAKKSVAEVISVIDAISLQSGVALKSLAILEDASRSRGLDIPDSVGGLSIEAEISGSYAGVVQFISKMEKSLRLVDVGDLSISRGPNSTELDAAVSAKAYFIKK